jgi:hypothetical protein
MQCLRGYMAPPRLAFSLASATTPRGGQWMGVAFCTVEARWLLAGVRRFGWGYAFGLLLHEHVCHANREVMPT